MSTTFFKVSAACHGRSSRGNRAFANDTRVSIVGVSGVSSTWAAGASSYGSGGGERTRTASTFAA